MRLRHVERDMLKLGSDDVAFAKKKVGKKKGLAVTVYQRNYLLVFSPGSVFKFGKKGFGTGPLVLGEGADSWQAQPEYITSENTIY